jgi:hypothetical protein
MATKGMPAAFHYLCAKRSRHRAAVAALWRNRHWLAVTRFSYSLSYSFSASVLQGAQQHAAAASKGIATVPRALRPVLACVGGVPAMPPTGIMYDLAQCFAEQLGITNACLPASLLLHEILVRRGTGCRLRAGFLVLTGLPQELAVKHLWVELPGGDVLDIGGHLTKAAGQRQGLQELAYRLSANLPPGAVRTDLGDPALGASAAAAETAMVAMAEASSDAASFSQLAVQYWAGAPPPLQSFRAAMLWYDAL